MIIKVVGWFRDNPIRKMSRDLIIIEFVKVKVFFSGIIFWKGNPVKDSLGLSPDDGSLAAQAEACQVIVVCYVRTYLEKKLKANIKKG